MACFKRASPALVAILNKLDSAEKPTDTDHNLYEFGSVRYHVQASASDPEIIYLSISTPPLSPEVLLRNGLPDCTLQDIRRGYCDIADIVEPPKEGFVLTLRLDFAKLPHSREDRIKAISKISSLQAVILSSQLKDMLWNLGSQDMAYGMCKPIKLVYHPREPFFVIRMPEKLKAIFPMRFKDNSDVILATSLFQELMDMGHSAAFTKAPRCTWSPIPPPELRGEPFEYLTTNGGFVSFDILSHHVKGAKVDRTVWILLNFYAHVKYYVKCTRGFIQIKMRQRLESLVEVMQNARIRGGGDDKKLQNPGCKRVKKWMSFSKSKILKRRCSAIANQIKRMRARIRIKGLDRFRRKWFRVPKFPSLKKYTKLE
ncbi:actin-related protein 2/3 complex subunit 2B isoform X1 [Phoenix dactylifera]|uniref:Arp2/3 complex 34 kDa subunit n=1 Tax=Phoenix dactylifera TaxID=42345 RepID=A0A8B7MWI2_PHODC|nr:actin-related protein 2/3 complex subunit 2B isoform X1 [Phoenix dactylifera]